MNHFVLDVALDCYFGRAMPCTMLYTCSCRYYEYGCSILYGLQPGSVLLLPCFCYYRWLPWLQYRCHGAWSLCGVYRFWWFCQDQRSPWSLASFTSTTVSPGMLCQVAICVVYGILTGPCSAVQKCSTVTNKHTQAHACTHPTQAHTPWKPND